MLALMLTPGRQQTEISVLIPVPAQISMQITTAALQQILNPLPIKVQHNKTSVLIHQISLSMQPRQQQTLFRQTALQAQRIWIAAKVMMAIKVMALKNHRKLHNLLVNYQQTVLRNSASLKTLRIQSHPFINMLKIILSDALVLPIQKQKLL
jgi:hypothetical protein